jgi:four helix bundle protein
MKLTHFEDLECWQEARELVRMVYAAVANNGAFQRDLRFVGQITAAAVSIMNNTCPVK